MWLSKVLSGKRNGKGEQNKSTSLPQTATSPAPHWPHSSIVLPKIHSTNQNQHNVLKQKKWIPLSKLWYCTVFAGVPFCVWVPFTYTRNKIMQCGLHIYILQLQLQHGGKHVSNWNGHNHQWFIMTIWIARWIPSTNINSIKWYVATFNGVPFLKYYVSHSNKRVIVGNISLFIVKVFIKKYT